MISEVDIRDWEKIDIERAKETIDNLDDFARMANINPIGAISFFEEFFKQLELIRDRQIKASSSKIPALFRKGEE